MPRPNEREIKESWERSGLVPDEEDIELVRHVMGLDELPPQGLHRGGFKKGPWEDDAVEDYYYPWPAGHYDDGSYEIEG